MKLALPMKACKDYSFVNEVKGGNIPKEYIPPSRADLSRP
jgi:hypothetical protein